MLKIEKLINLYDAEGRSHVVSVAKDRDHYMVYLDGKFYTSCDTKQEADLEVDGIPVIYKYSFARMCGVRI